MKRLFSAFFVMILLFSFLTTASASTPEPSRTQVHVLLNNASATQGKLCCWNPYSKTAVSKALNKYFTNGFIDTFFSERMEFYGIGKSGLLYNTILPTDNMFMFLTDFSWSSDTKVSYLRAGKYKYIRISEFVYNEMDGNNTYTVTLIKAIDSAQPYKILSIDRAYEE
ncbi:DUF3993 domain-containing protein [Neobacillus sp. PS3-40]|uniref:DUF3993 domain-containing protein n=1 Tax=Neobacillus sp. PS3-40 TaxID=3070679 RepID=UPI0027E0382F|nr:DUF3993 domain-containing protein [Neobacillus sp. PS3-40]WML46125.1 DUF3993 domain-containing protein [Neobacillus sp. PS3-40]